MDPAPPLLADDGVARALRDHPEIADAVVLPAPSGAVAFVVLGEGVGAAPDPQRNAVREKVWSGIWDGVYASTAAREDASLNAAGYVNSATGLPYSDDEMRDHIEPTVRRILDLSPRRVLEIGCGGGMLLFRVAPRCAHYVGTDFSAAALAFVRARLDALGAAAPAVTLLQRSAIEDPGFEPGTFDAVVLSSVLQYFPSVEYLLAVLRLAVTATAPGGSIFLGDVRHRGLLGALHAEIEARRAPPTATADELRQRVRKAVTQDKELVVDPAIVVALQRVLPEIDRARVELRRGRHHNEMTQFRFDATLHKRAGGTVKATPEAAPPWLAWGTDVASVDALASLLRDGRHPVLRIRAIPNRRVLAALRADHWIRTSPPEALAGELLAALSQPAEGIDPEWIWALGGASPYHVEIGWSADRGGFDAVFSARHGGGASATTGIDATAAARAALLPVELLATGPMSAATQARLTQRLLAYLADRAPGAVAPSRIVPLVAIPRDAQGEVRGAELRALLEMVEPGA